MDWKDISTAPKDAQIIAGYFNQPWSESHREGRVVTCWFQPEFEAFISGCSEITMAPGYTIDGQTRKLHSPSVEKVTHWLCVVPKFQRGEHTPKEKEHG